MLFPITFLLVLFGGLILASGLQLAWAERGIDRGRVAPAVVRDRAVRTRPGTAESNPKDYIVVSFEFRDDAGRSHRIEREVRGGEAWADSRPGDPAPDIEYSRGEPPAWRFAAESGLWQRLTLVGGVSVLAAFGLPGLCRWYVARRPGTSIDGGA